MIIILKRRSDTTGQGAGGGGGGTTELRGWLRAQPAQTLHICMRTYHIDTTYTHAARPRCQPKPGLHHKLLIGASSVSSCRPQSPQRFDATECPPECPPESPPVRASGESELRSVGTQVDHLALRWQTPRPRFSRSGRAKSADSRKGKQLAASRWNTVLPSDTPRFSRSLIAPGRTLTPGGQAGPLWRRSKAGVYSFLFLGRWWRCCGGCGGCGGGGRRPAVSPA